jgi:2-polyprenyl-6-methoxyphenol hydroxylase-like FAD-dependent oxidoreductase
VPRFDAVIVGAGPAGSTAALGLARAGARVALVDRRAFPRDKACGDLVGPRGVRLLAELGVAVADARQVGDMIVVGPSGRRVLLPALAGRDYPGYALAVSRLVLDRALFDAAVAAGACPVRDLFVGLSGDPRAPTGVQLAGGGELRADVVIGADGATSRVAAAAGLVEAQRALWGFALRAYLDAPVELPHIRCGSRSRGDCFPVTAGSSRPPTAGPTSGSGWAWARIGCWPGRPVSVSTTSASTCDDRGCCPMLQAVPGSASAAG